MRKLVAGCRLVVSILALIAANVSAHGEVNEPGTLSPITVGSKVRLRAPTVVGDRIQGIVLQTDERYLVVRGSDAAPLRVPRDAITRLEIITGRHGNAMKGMWIGAGLGALAWGINPCVNEGCTEGFSVEFAVYGALLGGMTGAGIGALIKSDRWSEVPLDRVWVGVAPVRGHGAALSVSVGF